MLAGVTPFGLHRLPVIYRAFGTAYANCYIIAKSNPKITIQRISESCFTSRSVLSMGKKSYESVL